MLGAMFFRLTRPAPAKPAPPDLRPFALADGRCVDVRWVRDARARRLRLIVSEKGARLTLPRSVSERTALAFLHEHRGWLADQLGQLPVVSAQPLQRGVETHLPLRGEHVPLHWREGRYARAELREEGVVLQLPERASSAQLKSALRDFYTQQARQDLGAWLPRYLPGLPRAPLSFRLRPLSSLWGSLSPTDALSLDLSLVLGRPAAFEYVLVHELCHLIHADHSPRFWREVEARWPHWREQRTYLRGEGMSLKAQLARLLG